MKYTDEQILDYVERIRSSRMEIKVHPLEDVKEFLRKQSTKGQIKRLYGCTDAGQAAGRACHGDAFRF